VPCSPCAASTLDNTATSVCCSRKVFLHVSLHIITNWQLQNKKLFVCLYIELLAAMTNK
jgi:hypothetical protein